MRFSIGVETDELVDELEGRAARVELRAVGADMASLAAFHGRKADVVREAIDELAEVETLRELRIMRAEHGGRVERFERERREAETPRAAAEAKGRRIGHEIVVRVLEGGIGR